MADPNSYSRGFSFTDYQTATPQDPLPGQHVDIELDDIAGTLASVVDAIKDVRRSDGKLQNGSVTKDALSVDFNIGFSLRGVWALATEYATGDAVVYNQKFYKALASHTASAPTRPDLSPATWQYLTDLIGGVTPDNSISTAKLIDGSVTTAKLADASVATAKLIDGSVATAKLADGAVTDVKVASVGPTKIPFTQTGTGAVATNLDAILKGGAYVTPQQFGAVGDGTTNDTAAFQAALNTLKPVIVPYVASGYKVANLTFATGMSLICPRKVRFIASATFATIGSGSITTDVTISGCLVDMQTSTSGGGFVFRSSVGKQWRVTITDCDVIGSFGAFIQDTDNANYIFDTHLTRCRAYFPRATPFLFYNLQGFVILWSCFADYTYDGTIEPINGTITLTAPSVTFPGFVIGGTNRSVGYQLHWCSTFGRGGGAGATSGASGFVITNSTSPTFVNCDADTLNGRGWAVSNTSHGRWTSCSGFATYETCFDLSTLTYCQFTDCKAVGVKGGAPGAATAKGVLIASSSKCTFNGIQVDDVKDSGIVISAGVRVHISGGRVTNAGATGYLLTAGTNDCALSSISADSCGGDGLMFDSSARNTVASFSSVANTGKGITAAGTSNFNVASALTLVSNTAGNGVVLGTGSAVSNYVNNAGAANNFLQGTVGGAVIA